MCLRSRKSEPTQRGKKSACISLYMHVKQNRGIKKNQKKSFGVSVLLHVRPYRSIQAHHAIGTGVCVDPIARLMCCLLRSIENDCL